MTWLGSINMAGGVEVRRGGGGGSRGGGGEQRMMLSLGLCNGKKRIHAMGRAVAGGEAPGPLVGAHRWRVPVPPLRQLVCRFRSQWRHAAGARGGRRARFGYDPESYSQNFDDGAAAGRLPSPPRSPAA